MTTTTRTTRKAPWAAVLTALLAVVALLFGAMTMAATATADPDPNKTPPGQSEEFVPPGQDEGFVPPGQENTPPGQVDDDSPGASHEKLTICHKVEGLGETGEGWNIITMNEQAWAAHQAHHASMDFVVTANTPCPPPQPTYCPDDAQVNAGLVVPEGQTIASYCTTTPTTPDTPTTPTTSITPTTVIPAEQAAAIDAAIAATEPEAVAPVLPATVETETPETVAVPAPATVATPAAVPAGDGSTVPQVPVALLALLALATAAAVTSGLRMATNR